MSEALKVIPCEAVILKIGEGEGALFFLRLQKGNAVSWTQSLGGGWHDLAGGLEEVEKIEADFQAYLKGQE